MNFLAPLFLLGAAAVSLPVVFHLIRRNTRKKTIFSSLLFLQPTPPRLRERSRLEDILLLLLRCLALGLLALAFARPFLKRADLVDPASNARERLLVLVDASASMQRKGLWDAAVARALDHVRKAGIADQVAVSTFGRVSLPLVSFEAWAASTPDARVALVGDQLRAAGPGWAATHLGSALINATEALGELPEEKGAGDLRRRVVLISDFQEGCRLETLQGYDWPKDVQLTLDPVKSTGAGNAGLQWLPESTPTPGATQAVVRVRVFNASDSREDHFQIGWDRSGGTRASVGRQEVQVPPGANKVLTLNVPREPGLDRIVLEGDAEPFDNVLHVVPPAFTGSRLLYVGNESPADPQQPLYFLRRVFADTNGISTSLSQVAPANFKPDETTQGAGLMVLATALPPATLATLRERIQSGAAVLYPLPVDDDGSTLAGLLGLPALPMTEARLPRYAMLAELDFKHPLLATFADPRFSDFAKVRVWRYRKFDASAIPGARVVARLDTGDPLWVETTVGRGRVLVLASGWHPADSQLALSSKFVPLLYSILDWAGAQHSAPVSYVVGEDIPVPAALMGVPRLAWRGPDGTETIVPAGTTHLTNAVRPGIHELTSSLRAARIAVNLDATESRTAPLALDDLEKLGLPVKSSDATRAADPETRRQLAANESESRQKLWRWFLAATLMLVLFETALAGWLTRRVLPTPAGESPA